MNNIKELRIGNLLLGNNEMVKVESVLSSRSRVYCHSIDEEYLIDYSINDLSPLPLTAELFVKFGFYKDGEYYSMGINDYKYCFKYRDWAKNWSFCQEYTDSNDPKDDGVKYSVSFDYEYVHQLQNLYYALTGKELTFKKNKCK